MRMPRSSPLRPKPAGAGGGGRGGGGGATAGGATAPTGRTHPVAGCAEAAPAAAAPQVATAAELPGLSAARVSHELGAEGWTGASVPAAAAAVELAKSAVEAAMAASIFGSERMRDTPSAPMRILFQEQFRTNPNAKRTRPAVRFVVADRDEAVKAALRRGHARPNPRSGPRRCRRA
jgi:hypothetical protein